MNDDAWDKPTECKALFAYKAQHENDLSFRAGDIIVVTTRTEQDVDWWEGKLKNGSGRGMFPSNYVKVLD